MVGANIPDEVKERYFRRDLKVQDLLDYPDVFNNIPIDYFMEYGTYISQFVRDNYGMGKFQELVQNIQIYLLIYLKKMNFINLINS